MTDASPDQSPVDESVETVALGDEGEVIRQENVGRDNMQGGGEWPDPSAPPSESAGGDTPERRSPPAGGGQFAAAYEAVGEDAAGASSIPADPNDQAPTVT